MKTKKTKPLDLAARRIAQMLKDHFQNYPPRLAWEFIRKLESAWGQALNCRMDQAQGRLDSGAAIDEIFGRDRSDTPEERRLAVTGEIRELLRDAGMYDHGGADLLAAVQKDIFNHEISEFE